LLRDAIPEIQSPKAYKALTGSEALPHDLVMLKKAVIPASKKSLLPRLIHGGLGATAGAALGAAKGHNVQSAGEGALLGAALSSPAALSHLALLASNPGLAQLLIQGPRLAANAMSQQGDQPQGGQ
jgi:hypothetical protein